MINNIIKNKYEIILKSNYLHIKYYSRIGDIDCNKINVYLDKCNLLICGSSLIVCAMNEYEIVIKGNVTSIQFINE